jgi:tRNA(Ile2) C34 agmatinyltransferase TiaS
MAEPPFREIVRREPLLPKVCPVCGQTFEGLGRRRYCGRACAQHAAYERHAEVRKAARRERYQQLKHTP